MARIDRRALFTSGAAAALLAASRLSASEQPRSGGRLRVAVARDEGTLDLVARAAVFDTLTEVAPDGVLRGELATGWHGSSDARAWEFALREGVRFHNGVPFTARDAVAALERQEIDIGASIACLEATGPHRLRIELKTGNPDLPYLLSDPALAISEADCRPEAPGVGTGLYALQRHEPGRHFLGRRVAKHYKDGRAGWFDSIDVVAIPDPAVRAEALRDGFVDVAEWPLSDGLIGRGEFVYRPSSNQIAIAARTGVGVPTVIGARGPLDDGRIGERWWMA